MTRPTTIIPAAPGFTRVACGVNSDGSEWHEALPVAAWRHDGVALEPVVPMLIDARLIAEQVAVELPDGRVVDEDTLFPDRAAWAVAAIAQSKVAAEASRQRQAQGAKEREAELRRPRLADLIRATAA